MRSAAKDPDSTEEPLELTRETFVGEEKANQMLTREYRKPFEVPSEEQI